MLRHTTIWVLAAGLAAGCGGRAELEPGPGAQPAPPGPGGGAATTVDGVTVVARTEAWSGFPTRLEEVTPVQVTIENESGRPLRVRYERIVLAAPTGQSYRAIPPFDVRGRERERVDGFRRDGFFVAPHLRRYYPRARFYDGYFPYDPFYYDRYYPAFVDVNLPTGDMIQKALPEGVLMPGSRITGFLYFENVDDDLPRVDMRMELVDASTGERYGVATIPFTV
ncbi:MAG: hypothetical protein ACOC9N_03335, partial [Gemmatimonadota bacterium]